MDPRDKPDFGLKDYIDHNEGDTIHVTLEGETRTLPGQLEICPRCDGHGSHVHPNIDRQGISGREMRGEFARAYRRGDYDIPCGRCQDGRIWRFRWPISDPDDALFARRVLEDLFARRQDAINTTKTRMKEMGHG